MKSLLGAVLLAAAIMPGQASASPYGDDLTKCIVGHTSEADNLLLAKWIFVAMSASSKIKDMSNVSAAQRTEVNLSTSKMFNRLITNDCRAETVAALKYDGQQSLESAFELLGKVAMQSLMGDPGVQANLSGLNQAFDKQAFNAMMIEAGLKPKTP